MEAAQFRVDKKESYRSRSQHQAADGRKGFTQQLHGRYSDACPRGAGGEEATADAGARYDHARALTMTWMMMNKQFEQRAHQSMIESQATDWGVVASASQGLK